MKRQTLLLFTAAISAFAFTTAFSQEGVEVILEELAKQKVEALEAYLAENPEASDRGLAVEGLIESYTVLGNDEKALTLLEERYNGLEKGEGADLQFVLIGNAMPIIEGKAAAGDKEGALAFIETVRSDFKGHAQEEQIEGLLGQISGSLAQPQVGDKMDISFTATDGTEVDLAAMDGKVVLVDFWATWCPPCVAEMPNVIAAHKTYQEKGFEVVGISLDQDKAALEAYVTENAMPWPQYFDGKGWQNELAGKFGITGIPATFLIGKDGKIAATNLRGAELEAKVAELLGE